MKSEIVKKYISLFGKQPSIVVKSPGRINIIGEHIDYNDGLVLPATIDKGIYFAMSIEGNVIDINAYQRNEKYLDLPKPDWAIYIDSIRRILNQDGKEMPNFKCVIGADLPSGAGLSSSSALCVGLWYGLNHLMKWKFTQLEIALLAQQTEQMTGIQCGVMDQFTITHGQANAFIRLDCLDNSYSIIDLNLDNLKFLLLNSNVDHHLTSSAYNDRREVAHSARQKMMITYPAIHSFRDVSINHIHSSDLSEEEKKLSTYVINEIKRVDLMVAALKNNNKEQVAKILNDGHEGLSRLYNVTCKETDYINKQARRKNGIYAARQMGGGFGGCMLLFVDSDLPYSTIEQLMIDYKKYTGISSQCIPMKIEDGVKVL